MNQHLQAPYFRKVDIVQRVKHLHDGYFKTVGDEQRCLGINFDHFYEEYIYPEFGIQLVENLDLGYDVSGEKILGLFHPNENIAYIDRMLKQTDDPLLDLLSGSRIAGDPDFKVFDHYGERWHLERNSGQ